MTARLPETHPTLGRPAKVYPYRDESGDIVAAVYRFEPGGTGQTGNTGSTGSGLVKPVLSGTGRGILSRFIPVKTGSDGGCLPQTGQTGKKEIRPYCLKSGDWVRPAGPVLYDLEAITANRSEPVILVEGEKCVDALAGLGFLASTSMGGSNAARFTDWSPLAGRDVIIWPDNDEPGAKYAGAVADLCLKAGATRVRVVDLSPVTLQKAGQTGLNRSQKQVLTGSTSHADFTGKPVNTGQDGMQALPSGWDAADAVAEGWGREEVDALLARARPCYLPPVAVATNDNWPAPDLSLLDSEPVRPGFPVEIFPPLLADWMEKAAKSKSAPTDYVAAALLTGAASLIGSARRVQLWEGWSEPAILWSAIVGNPSAGKSPAMDPVLSAMAGIEGDSVADFEEELRQFETLKMEAELIRSAWERKAKEAVELGGSPPLLAVGAQSPERPVRKRLTLRDATSEALLAALNGQPKGLMMVRDELAGWFASFDRYAGSKGGDRALWLEAFGGRPYVLDRVKNGGEPVFIPSLAVSVLGGMQPDKLESCLWKGDDDGLSSRFLFFYPLPAGRERPLHSADQAWLERVMRTLSAITHDVDENGRPLARHIPLSEEAIELFHPWWQALPERDGDHARMNGWWGKAQGKAARLALVFEYLDWAVSGGSAEPVEVRADTLARAIHFIDAYAGPMAELAHGAGGKAGADANTRKLAGYIREQGLSEFSVRDLQRSGPMRTLKAPEIKTACFDLAGYGWVQAAPVRQGETPGKSQGRFIVNPAIL
jgi:hypothetical protein